MRLFINLGDIAIKREKARFRWLFSIVKMELKYFNEEQRALRKQ